MHIKLRNLQFYTCVIRNLILLSTHSEQAGRPRSSRPGHMKAGMIRYDVCLREKTMNETELRHVIAMLLEDARRLQQIEPNAGTKARIRSAEIALKSGDKESACLIAKKLSVKFDYAPCRETV